MAGRRRAGRLGGAARGAGRRRIQTARGGHEQQLGAILAAVAELTGESPGSAAAEVVPAVRGPIADGLLLPEAAPER